MSGREAFAGRARGLFVAFEGLDGAGTTTQAHRLARFLRRRGARVVATREPSRGPAGRLIRRALRGEVPLRDRAALALLYAADRVDHVRRVVEPGRARGAVVTDRYVYSSLAYQSLDCDLDWVASLNRLAPEPDLTIYLRVAPEVAHARVGRRGAARELFERLELQRRVAEAYDRILGGAAPRGGFVRGPAGWERRAAVRRPRVAGRRPSVAVVDGTPPADAVAADIRALVRALLARR